jgi:pilus assembly protein CpaF
MYPALNQIYELAQKELAKKSIQGELKSRLPKEVIDDSAKRVGIELTNKESEYVHSLLLQSQSTFGILQALVDDDSVTDIIVKEYSKIYVRRLNKTSKIKLSFPSNSVYKNFLDRLLYEANTTFSSKKPIADGMIGSFARIHVVHESLCESGPYLTIRLNRIQKISLKQLVSAGMIPECLHEYLSKLLEKNLSVLIVGEVGTGKTTLARALACTTSETESIVVIEDTPEIYLDHPHVRYLRTREENTEGEGKVSSSQCIRAGMRMAMDRVILGEIRDAEAAESFIDVCSSGHTGLSTIHAKNSADSLTRLELFLSRSQKGVSPETIKKQIVTAVQVILFVDFCKYSVKRKIFEVREIVNQIDGSITSRLLCNYVSKATEQYWMLNHTKSSFEDTLDLARSFTVGKHF